MIGKIMSEAAHSIIGIFSAKPITMEQHAANSEFGNLMRSHHEQDSDDSATEQMSELVTEAGAETSTVLQPLDTNNILAIPTQIFGGTLVGQHESSPNLQLSRSPDTRDLFTKPEATRPGDGLTISTELEVEKAKGGAAASILHPRTNVQPSETQQIARAPLKNLTSTGSDEVSPTDRGGIVKLQNQEPQPARESGERLSPNVKTSVSTPLETRNTQFANLTDKPETDKYAVPVSPVTARGIEQAEAQTERYQSGFRSSSQSSTPVSPFAARRLEQTETQSGRHQSGSGSLPQSVPPVAQPDLPKTTVAEALAQSFENEMEPDLKKLNTLSEPQPLMGSPSQLATRATSQRPISFDLSTTQLAERLAAEIAGISVDGGSKKFEINPRNLGRMEITFSTRGAAEIVDIQTEHRGAKDMIMQHAQMLQDILKSQGREDLTLRVEVRENLATASKADDGNMPQQENDNPGQHRASQLPGRPTESALDETTGPEPASDDSRYA